MKYRDKLLFLRNQDKIKAALGDKKLEIIKASIQSVMDSDEEIEPQKIDGAPYDIMMIDDVSGEYDFVVFYIIKAEFSIYKIAFKEFI